MRDVSSGFAMFPPALKVSVGWRAGCVELLGEQQLPEGLSALVQEQERPVEPAGSGDQAEDGTQLWESQRGRGNESGQGLAPSPGEGSWGRWGVSGRALRCGLGGEAPEQRPPSLKLPQQHWYPATR